ncbi:MAG: NAD-dependent epimerase/dehydratase family protein, partial [Cyanobacteria bacterium M_surface_7_m2_040]|nr:NAD-dependent epimerase/dehydratase family protein [Cyanobacteria bacterium M_surface_7_m2_040]
MSPQFWQGRRVLLTGHTGFKGSWLALWLRRLGADVLGVALPPDSQPSLYDQLQLEEQQGLGGGLHSRLLDLRDLPALADAVQAFQPELVFHLAAQPLVRLSYAEPLTTWQTNVIGSLHLLEALRPLQQPCAVVVITTDKVYRNQEWCYGYREN